MPAKARATKPRASAKDSHITTAPLNARLAMIVQMARAPMTPSSVRWIRPRPRSSWATAVITRTAMAMAKASHAVVENEKACLATTTKPPRRAMHAPVRYRVFMDTSFRVELTLDSSIAPISCYDISQVRRGSARHGGDPGGAGPVPPGVERLGSSGPVRGLAHEAAGPMSGSENYPAKEVVSSEKVGS